MAKLDELWENEKLLFSYLNKGEIFISWYLGAPSWYVRF